MKQCVKVEADAGKDCGRQEHLWRYIGYDECNYTYLTEGKELLHKFGSLGDAPYYFRTHFMFCTGNCHSDCKYGSTNLYWEDKDGRPNYDFTYYDKIIDAYLETGNKPFVELGFMPMDLADYNYMFPHNIGKWESFWKYKEKGWMCPPKSYEKWRHLIEVLITHLEERYGREEVTSWYFELWNEPDALDFYWKGTAAEYCKLYDYTEAAVHSVNPQLRLSGPAVTGIHKGGIAHNFFRFFLDHCKNGANYCTGEKGTQLDFITFHVKGGGFPFERNAPKAVPSVELLVHQVKLGLDDMVEFGYEDREVVLSEADPDGWAAGGIYDNTNLRFRNTEYYASYVASTYEKIDRLSKEYGILVRPLAWAFLFPGERCFEGTRTFTTQGIDKAVFNLFKIYGSLGETKLELVSDGELSRDYLNKDRLELENLEYYTGEGEKTEVSGFAVKGTGGEVQIVLYSHNNDIDCKDITEVELRIKGLSGDSAAVEHYRIDADHSNPCAEWERQGKPLFPTGEQYQAIKDRDGLEPWCEELSQQLKDGVMTLTFPMPAHAVSYLVIRGGTA